MTDSYVPSTNLEFEAYDFYNKKKEPQPAFDTVTTTSEACPPAEVWRAITYRDYNGDYVPMDYDSENEKVVEDYSPLTWDNEPKDVKVYKRSPLECCNPV